MNNQNAPRVESSTENLIAEQTARTFNLAGLEDIARSIIPVPYYKFVQPSTEKAFLPDGTRAEDGSFLMPDVREAAKELMVVILRAKRATRMQNGEKVVSLKILGINLERMRPFILSVPVTSFSALGKVFEEMELAGAVSVWDYPIHLASEEVNRNVETDQGIRPVTYNIVKADLVPVRLDDKGRQIAKETYQDFAEKLDREEDDEEKDGLAEIAGKQ